VLLAHHADANAGGINSGWSPLHFAVVQLNKEIVALLLANGADPNARIQAREPLLEHVPPGSTPLLMAVRAKDTAMYTRAKVEFKSQAAIIELLLGAKADPNLASGIGETPLLATISLAEQEIGEKLAALLLEHGADPEAKGFSGVTPLMMASSRGKRSFVELLIRYKADVNAKGPEGYSALHSAAQHSEKPEALKIAELLLASGADINATAQNGTTALNQALLDRNQRHEGNESAAFRQMAALLRQHGALDEIPRMDRIGVRRASMAGAYFPLIKGTNDWNHFKLVELLGVHFDMITVGGPTGLSTFRFPDFSRVVIRRLSPDKKKWEQREVNLAEVLESTNRVDDPYVEWGDVVELTEAVPPGNQGWPGFSKSEVEGFKRCLTRVVEVTIKGATNTLVLTPSFGLGGGGLANAPLPVHFSIRPVLLNSRLLMRSSDLSRVRVTRRDAVTGKTVQWVLDCRESQPEPDLWLKDGDKIEIPETQL
jgi:ankyrin repeat protein